MTKSHRKRRAGRPRKSGPRKPCGRLQQVAPEPNPRVVADRTALMGSSLNLENADHPLDLALARGWLTERQHRTGGAFARVRRAASLGSPSLSNGGLVESPDPSRRDMRTIAQMPGVEIVEAWDRALPVSARSTDERASNAMKTWRDVCAALAPAELAEVERVCALSSWPQWLIQRCHGNSQSAWENRYVLLVKGLDKAADILFAKNDNQPEPKPDPPPALAASMPRGPIREETTFYVDQNGNPLFEAVRRVRW